MIIYKVVKVLKSGKYVSCLAYGKYKLNYIPNEETKAKKGYVMCFKYKYQARLFINSMVFSTSRYSSWKIIKAIPTGRQIFPDAYTWHYGVKSLTWFLNRVQVTHRAQNIRKPYKGMMCFPSVLVLG